MARTLKVGGRIRPGLLAVTWIAALFAILMVVQTPNLNRVDLIRGDNPVLMVWDLQPSEAYTQPVYIYRSFEHLELIRAKAEAEHPVGIEITRDGQPVCSVEAAFEAGQETLVLDLAGEGGTYAITLENRGEAALSLPFVEASRYDIARNTASGEVLQQIGVYRESSRPMWTYLCAIVVLALLTTALACGAGRAWSRRKAMVCILIICGVYLLLFPAWNINDFGTHFATACSYANTLQGVRAEEPGALMIRAEDDYFFRYILEDPYQLFYQPSRRSYDDAGEFLFQRCADQEMISYTGYYRLLRDYGVWNYLPYVLGIVIARALGLNLITAIFLARICGIAFYAAGIYIALRRLPDRLMIPVTVLCCLPMCALNLTAVSYDALCYVLVLNLFALLFALREAYRPRDAALLVVCALALGMAKGGAYVPFLLSLPLLLSRGGRRGRRLLLACLAAAAFGLAFNYRALLLGRGAVYQFGGEGVGTYYARWAFEHPVQYLLLMARTYLRQTDKLYSVAGLRLGWNAAVLPEYVCGLFLLLLGFSCGTRSPEEKPAAPLRRRERFWLWLPMGLIIVLTPIMLLSNTFSWMDTIDGVQGRYFLPLLIPLMLLFDHNLRDKITCGLKDSSLMTGAVGVLSLASVYYIGLTFLRI